MSRARAGSAGSTRAGDSNDASGHAPRLGRRHGLRRRGRGGGREVRAPSRGDIRAEIVPAEAVPELGHARGHQGAATTPHRGSARPSESQRRAWVGETRGRGKKKKRAFGWCVVGSEENKTLSPRCSRRSARRAQRSARTHDDMPKSLGERTRSGEAKGPRGPLCPHGKGKGGYYCRECPGKGICEHGRQRSQCKECGGSQICEHGRQRSQCKDCREARAASARVIRPPPRLVPAAKAELEIKREPSDTSDPGVDPDAEVASNVKPKPTDTPDPGIVEP